MEKSAGERTKERILKAGLLIWPNITLQAVAKVAKMTHPNILYHFPQGILKDSIAEYAVSSGNSRIIVQLMAEGHRAADRLSPAERIKHFNELD